MSISTHITRHPNYSTINDSNQNESKTNLKEKYSNFIEKNQAFFTAFILCSMSLLNLTDRYIVSSVLLDVQAYFKLTKSTAGLLQSAFLISYMIFSPINGYLGDKFNRKYLLVLSILLWAISTIAGSFIGSDYFILFVLTRCLFGVATASFEIIAIPIIGDKFDYNHKIRNRVLILFHLGSSLGAGLSYLISLIAKDIKPNDWRLSMRITPFALVFILFVVLIAYKEPSRETRKTIQSDSDSDLIYYNRPKFLGDLKILLKNKTFLLLNFTLTTAVSSFVGFGWWSPTIIDYSLRNQQLNFDIDNLKKIYSLLQALSAAVGLFISYWLSSYLKKKSNPELDCICIAGGFFSCSVMLYIYLMTIEINAYLTMVIYVLMIMSFNLCGILESNLFLDIIPTNLRSRANSLKIFVLHLFGDISSPYWIGLIADKCIKDQNKNTIHTLLYCSQLSNYPLVFLLFSSAAFSLFMSFSFSKDKENAQLLIN